MIVFFYWLLFFLLLVVVVPNHGFVLSQKLSVEAVPDGTSYC